MILIEIRQAMPPRLIAKLIAGAVIVFILIMLGWFYVLALIILGGAIVNAMRLGDGSR